MEGVLKHQERPSWASSTPAPVERRPAAHGARAQMMFVGPDGDVVPSLTESEMREVDRVAIEETCPNLFQMMENAGRGLAVTALEMLDDLSPTGGSSRQHARSEDRAIAASAGTGLS